MTFEEYSELTAKTALKMKNDSRKIYYVLKLCGEVGEMAEKLHEYVFLDPGDVSEELTQALILEMGDVMWYVSRIPEEFSTQVDFSDDEERLNIVVDPLLAASRISEELGKSIRHGWHPADPPSIDMVSALRHNLPIILGAVRTACLILNISPSYVMARNIRKVFDRFAKGTTDGRGDNR
jgi:NTP pyrophosphatase (non-canonical NTP hydrolase)